MTMCQSDLSESATRDPHARIEFPATTGQDSGVNPGFYARHGKRIFDFFLILMGFPVVVILVGVSAFIVALDGHKPFYSQKRIGRGGRSFGILKLRTMVPDAEPLLLEHLENNPAAAREWTETQKLKYDPRITRFGLFLRKSSLDELPQLWNVLKGEMSLVGPRPMMLNQRDLYTGNCYFDLRPGITGVWQISDRNTCSFSDRARFDEQYAASLSFTNDLAILVKTVGVVMRGTGY